MDMSIEDGPGDTLNPSESLDPDERNLEDDGVVDPPDDWQEADKFGTTPSEEAEGESLDQKLAEEVPDVEIEDPPEIPVAIAPEEALSEDVVDAVLYEDGPEVIPDIDIDNV